MSHFSLRNKASSSSRPLFLERRRGWKVTAPGYGVGMLSFLILTTLALANLYRFLAGTQRVASQILVVDGSMPVQLFPRAADEFRRNGYRELWVVRGIEMPGPVSVEETRDDYVVQILTRHNVPPSALHSVLFSSFKKDRTYFAAKALQVEWHERGLRPDAFNVVTAGSRARRTQLLFDRAWRERVRIGVVALDDPAFDGRHWWRSSEGMREVLFGAVTYAFQLVYFGSYE